MRLALDTLPDGCGPSISELSMPVESEEHPGDIESPSSMAQKLKDGRFVVSVEMDPPRGLSVHKLIAGASLLTEAGADVINVADSPMARMRMSPWAVCDLVQRRVNVETTLHFPTRGRNLLRVQGDLLAAHAMGIRNVFVVMGDPTAIGDYPDAMDNYDLVPSGLIQLITRFFNVGMDHAGADIGQPTAFFVGCALNLCPQNPEQEMKILHRKLTAGAASSRPSRYEPGAEGSLKARPRARDTGPGGCCRCSAPDTPPPAQRCAGHLHPRKDEKRLAQAGEKAPQEGVRMALN
jgi:homocysteine S-methyltransferase